jgi:hypothetical protein
MTLHGPGIAPLPTRGVPRTTMDRIREIAQLSEDFDKAKAIEDLARRQRALRKVARAYKRIGMKERAAQIMHQAGG